MTEPKITNEYEVLAGKIYDKFPRFEALNQVNREACIKIMAKPIRELTEEYSALLKQVIKLQRWLDDCKSKLVEVEVENKRLRQELIISQGALDLKTASLNDALATILKKETSSDGIFISATGLIAKESLDSKDSTHKAEMEKLEDSLSKYHFGAIEYRRESDELHGQIAKLEKEISDFKAIDRHKDKDWDKWYGLYHANVDRVRELEKMVEELRKENGELKESHRTLTISHSAGVVEVEIRPIKPLKSTSGKLK